MHGRGERTHRLFIDRQLAVQAAGKAFLAGAAWLHAVQGELLYRLNCLAGSVKLVKQTAGIKQMLLTVR